MLSIRGMIDEVLGEASDAKDIPSAARNLIEGFEIMRTRTNGRFDFGFEQQENGGVHIRLTFNKASSNETKSEIDVAANGAVTQDNLQLSRQAIYTKDKYGMENRLPTTEEVVEGVIRDTAQHIKRDNLLAKEAAGGIAENTSVCIRRALGRQLPQRPASVRCQFKNRQRNPACR